MPHAAPSIMKARFWKRSSLQAGQGCGAEVSQAHHEDTRPTAEDRHRRTLILSATMKEIGNADRQEVGRRLKNRAENSHQPFRRREREMQRFRSVKTL
jgi:hypothetical protein